MLCERNLKAYSLNTPDLKEGEQPASSPGRTYSLQIQDVSINNVTIQINKKQTLLL